MVNKRLAKQLKVDDSSLVQYNSAPPIQHRRFTAVAPIQRRPISRSLNDFDLKKFRPFFKENYVFCS
ncbi:Hypothetical protein FKW44_022214, partial [Caligus rogercresseyi]